MKTGTIKKYLQFKFGKSLLKGEQVEITQTNGDYYMVRKPASPTIEYAVSKDNVKISKP